MADDICYRDIDTIERLLEALGADIDTLNIISQHKKKLLHKIAAIEAPVLESKSIDVIFATFKPGDIVSLNAN